MKSMEFSIFLDTNVVLDWLLDRPNCFAEESTNIIAIAENRGINIFISAGSVYTIAYILEKSGKKGNELRNYMVEILQILKVATSDNTPFLNACNNGIKDLEDAFQFEMASLNNSIKYFVTGNTKDFKNVMGNKLKIINPKEMLKFL